MLNGIDQITHLTFDCYGTLIDWESGILEAMLPLLQAHDVRPSPQLLLCLYVAHETRLERLGWRPYREILQDVCGEIGRDLGVDFTPAERDMLPKSLSAWPPFADTLPALRLLKERFRLVILSNVDDSLFVETARRLEVPFDEVITAEQVRSYKPGEAHFREALRRLSVPVGRILHVAQSLYHDHIPARQLGFRTVRVARLTLLPGTGLAPDVPVQPDLQVATLTELATRLLSPPS
jgi:2-haloacid dehalogenase